MTAQSAALIHERRGDKKNTTNSKMSIESELQNRKNARTCDAGSVTFEETEALSISGLRQQRRLH